MEETKENTIPGVDAAYGDGENANASEKESGNATDTAGRIKELEQRILVLEKENGELKDSWLRERAEFQNFKKRSSHDLMKARVQSVGRFITTILPIADNLDRVVGAKTENEEVRNFIAGIEMVRSQFMEMLGKENVAPLNPEGQPFDPYQMEAIATEERQGVPSDTVIEVYQNGYIMTPQDGERQVLRPARVKVCKAGV